MASSKMHFFSDLRTLAIPRKINGVCTRIATGYPQLQQHNVIPKFSALAFLTWLVANNAQWWFIGISITTYLAIMFIAPMPAREDVLSLSLDSIGSSMPDDYMESETSKVYDHEAFSVTNSHYGHGVTFHEIESCPQFLVNPATGLPMTNDAFDADGNAYGISGNWDFGAGGAQFDSSFSVSSM